jgi:hypothetical protein
VSSVKAGDYVARLLAQCSADARSEAERSFGWHEAWAGADNLSSNCRQQPADER